MDKAVAIIGLATAVLGLITAAYQFLQDWKNRPGTPDGTSSENGAHRRRGIFALVASLAVAALTAVAMIFVVPELQPSPTVTVISPRDDALVPFRVNVMARSEHVPAGSVIWPVILEDGAKYHPGDKPCDRDDDSYGALSCPTIYVGSDGRASVGKSFTILFCSADSEWQSKFKDYDAYVKASNDYSGIEHSELEGVKIAGRVRIKRKV